MQSRLAEELRALKFDRVWRPSLHRSESDGSSSCYRNSIQRVVTASVAAASTSSTTLIFPWSGSTTSSSSASFASSSPGSEAHGTPSSGPESYRLLGGEAFRGLSEIASHMVSDRYTERLITEFSRPQLGSGGGGDEILQTWFSDLGVDWVLGVDEMNLQEKPWSGVEEMIKGWLAALTVMAEALRLTKATLSSGDGDSGGVIPVLPIEKYRPQKSAPARIDDDLVGVTAHDASPGSGSSNLEQESSDPAPNRSRSIAIATVKQAITAYSQAASSRSFRYHQHGAEGTEFQFALFAKASLMKMMCFPVAIAALSRSPEKILRVIDMYAVVSGVSPSLLVLLPGATKWLISDRITAVLKTLSNMVRGILHDLETLIREEDSWRTTAQGNDIHPVNQYVLNYINLLLENRDVLNPVLQNCDVLVQEGENDDDDELFSIEELYQLAVEESSLTSTVTRLLNSVDAMIEVKSKMYSAAGGRMHIFLLNNDHFILQQSEPSLQAFMGACWYVQRRQRVNRHIKKYLDLSWGNVVSCLDYAWQSRRRSLFRRVPALVEFNSLLQTTYHTEKLWKINSPQLRTALRNSVCGKVISAYRAYLETHQGGELGTSATYTSEDLEDMLQNLFEG